MAKRKVYITYKHQEWTFDDKSALMPLLDGEDDEIREFYVTDENFAILLRNGNTFDVRDTIAEAENFILRQYRAYTIRQCKDDNCYFNRENFNQSFKTGAMAQEEGVFDYVFVPKGQFLLARYDKIVATAPTQEEIVRKMFKVFGCAYTYIG
ncbi:MAG: hypothetical protein IK048_01580 [Clostridia bacterium]|nr:hypothetical protein [Clostridia bacterium]